MPLDARSEAGQKSSYWYVRHSESMVFLIVTLALVGAYFAFNIPVSVFPTTNFPAS